MKYLMTYEMAPDGLQKVPALYPAHAARLQDFHGRGLLLAAGPVGQPPEGALSIFTTQEAAEEFAKGDPFVTEGVVARWRVQPWDAAFL
jgi:uncharacterized protein YciI